MLRDLTTRPLPAQFRRVNLVEVAIFLSPVLAIAFSLVIVGAVVLALDHDPIELFRFLVQGAFGSQRAFATALNKSVPLIFVALATAVAFRARIFSIGQEGQLQVGALAATWVALNLPDMTPVLVVAMSLAAAFAAGGVYGGIPGLMKAQWGLNEIITTIMLDYIAILWVLSLVLGSMQAPNAAYAHSPSVSAANRLPIILSGTRLHAGFALALVAAVLVWFLLHRTTLGFEIRGMGFNPRAAKNTGMPIKTIIVKTMILSGGIAGLAGAVQILGVQFQIAEDWSQGWGFTGIAVALLGGLRPAGIIIAGIFFGVLEAGADSMQALTGIPGQIVLLLQGLPVLFLMGLRSSTLISWLVKHSQG